MCTRHIAKKYLSCIDPVQICHLPSEGSEGTPSVHLPQQLAHKDDAAIENNLVLPNSPNQPLAIEAKIQSIENVV